MGFIELDFPREVLELGSNGKQGGRYSVRNWVDLERYWKGKNGSGNVFFTAYGYRATKPPKHHRVDYNTPIIRHFIMDFDCKDFKRRGADVEFSFMQAQVRRLHRYLMSTNSRHFIWFSGGGFHIWVPLSKMYTPSDGFAVSRIKEGGRKLISQWHKKLDLSCNDPAVAFDTSGMIRIPNSYNSRRGCWSIPLTSEELITLTHDNLMELAQSPRKGYIEQGVKDIIIELPTRRNPFTKKIEKVENLPDITLGSMVVLPCLTPALGEGNPTHRHRLHLASYLASRFRWFFPPESITDEDREEHVQRLCTIIAEQGWVDYDEGKTLEQVKSIIYGGEESKGLCAPSCRTIEYDGFCVGRCRYYDGSISD